MLLQCSVSNAVTNLSYKHESKVPLPHGIWNNNMGGKVCSVLQVNLKQCFRESSQHVYSKAFGHRSELINWGDKYLHNFLFLALKL